MSFQNCGGKFEALTSVDFASQSSTAPALVVTNIPSALTNSRNISVTIAASANKYSNIKKVTCTLDSAPPIDCLGAYSASGLADGDHTLKIQAQDSFNNLSETFVAIWKIDATKPVATFNQAPSAVLGTSSFNVTFSTDEQATFECALDAAAFAACTSPLALTALTETQHSLKVHAKDLAGNISADITTAFSVDLTAPVINIVNKPLTPTNATTATFTYNGTDAGTPITVFTCQLTSNNVVGTAAQCNAGTVTYNGLAAGTHVFSLKGLDSAGNMSVASTYTWVIDLTAPTLPVITANVTSPTKNTTASFQFSSTDASGIKNYECQLDSGAAEVCAAGQAKTYSGLSSASHTFKVRAADQAGNFSAFASSTWVIDNVLPTISVTSSVAASTTSTGAIMTIAAADPAPSAGLKSLECKLDTAAFALCTSPVTYSALTVGAHTFMARSTDNADNQSTATFAWTIATAPTPTPTVTPPPSGGAPTLSFTASSNSIVDGVLPGTTLTWAATNATSCTASGAWDNSIFAGALMPLNGTMTRAPSPAGSYSYVITCIGTGGNVSKTVALSVTPATREPATTDPACNQSAPSLAGGQAGISFPGGSSVQAGAPATLGCPSSTLFNDLAIRLDQSAHTPRHAVVGAAGTMPAALAGENLPYIPDVKILARRDTVLVYLPNIKGAADYRAYAVLNNKVSYINTATGQQPRGAVIACAGFRMHNYPTAKVNGAFSHELLQTIELPGFVNAGNYTIVVEALKTPCPFVGIQADVDASVIRTGDILSGTTAVPYAIFTSPETLFSKYGNEILNGQGASTNYNSIKTVAKIGQPVAPNDATFPSDPVTLARSAIQVQLPFFDETDNAPTIDVGPNAVMDEFLNDVAVDQNSYTVNPDQVNAGSYATKQIAPFGVIPNKWAFWGTKLGATGATSSLQIFQRHGRLYTSYTDDGHNGAAVNFSSLEAPVQEMDPVKYVHSVFRVNNESSMRRYWSWVMCGGATRAELFDDVKKEFKLRPQFIQTSFNPGGANPSVSFQVGIESKATTSVGDTDSLNKVTPKECISVSMKGDPEYGTNDRSYSYPTTERSSAIIRANIHPEGYYKGLIALGHANAGDGGIGLRYKVDAAGKPAGPILEPFDQILPLTHFNIFVRPDRLVVFINGRQAMCVDMSTRPLTMKYGVMSYGDVLYHSDEEWNEIANIGYNGIGPNSAQYNMTLNTPITTTRIWDNVGHGDKLDIPTQFSTFDPTKCIKPASTAVRSYPQ